MRKLMLGVLLACTVLSTATPSLADPKKTENMLKYLGRVDKETASEFIMRLTFYNRTCKRSRSLILAHFKKHLTEDLKDKKKAIALIKELTGEDFFEDAKVIQKCSELPLIAFGKVFKPIWDKDNPVEVEFALSEVGAVWQQHAGRLFLLYDALRSTSPKFQKLYKKKITELVKFGAEECVDEDFDWDFYGGHPNDKGKILPEKIKSDESYSRKKAFKKLKEAIKEASIGNHTDAIEVMNKLFAKVKKKYKGECLAGLAKIYVYNGDYFKAHRYYRIACKLDPNNSRIWTDRGWFYWVYDEYKLAFKYLTKGIRLARKSKSKKRIYDAYHMRGYCYLFIMHYKRAIADCESAQKLGKSKSFKVESLLLEIYSCAPEDEGLFDKKKSKKLYKKLHKITLSKVSRKKLNPDIVGRIYFALSAYLAKEKKFKKIPVYIKKALEYSKNKRDRYKFVGVNSTFFEKKKPFVYKQGKPHKLPEYDDSPDAKDEEPKSKPSDLS